MSTTSILILSFFLLMGIGVPIGVSLGCAAVLAMVIGMNTPLVLDTPKTLKIRSGCEGGGKGGQPALRLHRS